MNYELRFKNYVFDLEVGYIHYNPVAAEIIFHERDYVNSSYRNYEEDNTVFCNVNVEPLW